MILIGWLVMAAAMGLLWLVQRQIKNAGLVDAAWTFGVGGLGIWYALSGGTGDWARRVIAAGLIGAWALRLGIHILRRVLSEPEDGRYRALKEAWGSAAHARLFRFYQYQALGAALFAVPLLLVAGNPLPLGWRDAVGGAIWLAALAGEWIADRQLAVFRADPASRGQVCQEGLWRYSRHPNYFFEWLHWWAYACFAAGAPLGWLSALAPLAMLYFILYVTGIPPTEAQAIRSRGEAYRQYQRTTSPFVPWFRAGTS